MQQQNLSTSTKISKTVTKMAESDQSSNLNLQSINSASLGSSFPIITLPDGRKIPTGTVGACLVNIKSYDAAHASSADNDDAAQLQLQDLHAKIAAAVPTLKTAGMFDLFGPDEWIEGTTSKGR